MIFSETSVESRPSYYSVSRLKTYSQCSQYYKLKYVDKVPSVSFSESTITGNFCHDALEYFYGENVHLSLIECLIHTAKKTLIERCGFKNAAPDLFNKVYKDLVSFAKDSMVLYARASEWYQGDNPIRTKKGTIAKAANKTASWMEAEEKLGLNKKRMVLQDICTQINPDLEGIFVCNSLANAYAICFGYKQPEELVEVIYPEMPISDYKLTEEGPVLLNAVPMPEAYGGEEGYYLNGYIDVVGTVRHKGKLKKAIIDYKTSKEDFTEEEIIYNVQLFSYVYAYEYLTGEELEVMGIFNLRTNRLVLVDIDRALMADMLEALFSTHKAIKAEIFKKEIPDNSYCKCLNSYGKVCDFLQHCHPKLYEQKVGKIAEVFSKEYQELLELVS